MDICGRWNWTVRGIRRVSSPSRRRHCDRWVNHFAPCIWFALSAPLRACPAPMCDYLADTRTTRSHWSQTFPRSVSRMPSLRWWTRRSNRRWLYWNGGVFCSALGRQHPLWICSCADCSTPMTIDSRRFVAFAFRNIVLRQHDPDSVYLRNRTTIWLRQTMKENKSKQTNAEHLITWHTRSAHSVSLRRSAYYGTLSI